MNIKEFFKKYGDFSDSYKGDKKSVFKSVVINILVYVVGIPVCGFVIWSLIGLFMCM